MSLNIKIFANASLFTNACVCVFVNIQRILVKM